MTENEHTVECPNCKATFDMSKYIIHVKSKFFKAVEEVLAKENLKCN